MDESRLLPDSPGLLEWARRFGPLLRTRDGTKVRGNKEIVSRQADVKRIEKAMGDADRSRQTNDNELPWVKLRAYAAKPMHATDGKLSIDCCFDADTNIADYNVAMSHGPIGAAECAPGRVPERFASFEQTPVVVVSFARDHAKEVISGWSILAGTMPDAAMRLLTNRH